MAHELKPGTDTPPAVAQMMRDHWRRATPAQELERMLVILQKLMWFVEAGGSERQWGDALGVVQTRRSELDLQYLETHASSHAVAELLARLLAA